jgi:membrane-associated protein
MGVERMEAIANWVLAFLRAYGIPVLLVVSFFGSLGIPFPITAVIIAAGAFARQGLYDWRMALGACLLGASLADHSEYLLGRLAGPRLRQRLSSRAAWKEAQATVQRRGGVAILITRFWLTTLAPPINMIAGMQIPYGRFLYYDLAGELVWALLYGGLGFFFAGQWMHVSQLVSGFSWLSLGLVILATGLYLWTVRRRRQE